jgi:hypothetical protein
MATANRNGAIMERLVHQKLKCRFLDITQQTKMKDVFNNDTKMDLTVKSQYLSKTIQFEIKYQNVAGSVEQKLPYVFMNLDHLSKLNNYSVFVYGGNYYDSSTKVKNSIKKLCEIFPTVTAVKVQTTREDNQLVNVNIKPLIDYICVTIKNEQQQQRFKMGRGEAPASQQTGREVTTENTQLLRTVRRFSDGDASYSSDASHHRNNICSGH